MLSNMDLKKELGTHIGLYPFDGKNIEGASIYFTASIFAWSLKTKQSAVIGNKIKIAVDDATIIFTKETITIDQHFAGICLARVSHTVKGLSSSGTPIKPGWTGRLTIVLQNNSEKEREIDVGDTIAVVMLNKLKRTATFSDEKGGGGRFDLLASLGIQITEDALRSLNQRHFTNRADILKKMKEDESFKKYMKDIQFDSWFLLIGLATLVTIIEMGFLIFTYWNTKQIDGFVALLFAPTLSFLSMLVSKRVS